MNSQESVIDDASQREEVKRIHEHVIDFLVVLVETLSSEIEEVCHLSTLVIASNEGNRIGKGDL